MISNVVRLPFFKGAVVWNELVESFVLGLAIFGAGYLASFVFLPPLASDLPDFERIQKEHRIFLVLSFFAAVSAGVVSFVLRHGRKP